VFPLSIEMLHPNIRPKLVIEVDEARVAAHVAQGWVPVTVQPIETEETRPTVQRRRKVTNPEEGADND
jgi:hypothetical protein